MPFYALTVNAVRHGPDGYSNADVFRTFTRYVEAASPGEARTWLLRLEPRGPITGAVTDPSDGAWFDSSNIRKTREVTRYTVVTTDNTAWHSNGITGRSVFYGKREASKYLRLALAACLPGQGAFLRIDAASKPKIVQTFPSCIHVTDANAISARSAATRCVAVARKHFGGPVMVVSSGGAIRNNQVDYTYVFTPRAS